MTPGPTNSLPRVCRASSPYATDLSVAIAIIEPLLAAADLALVRPVFGEVVEQRRLATGGVEDAGAQTHDAARRDLELQVHAFRALDHVGHLAAAGPEDLDDLAGVLARHVDHGELDRLERPAALLLEDDARAADLELVALAPHRLHEHGEVQHAAAGDLHALLVGRLRDVHRDVGLRLAQQALLDLATADDGALLTDERARGRGEDDRHGRLLDVDRIEPDRVDAAREHVADVGVVHADDRADVAGVGGRGLDAAHALEREELLDGRLVAANRRS